MKTLFDGEEIVCEREKYAVFGTIVDSNLYQSVRSDIIGTDLHCLAQVKRVFPYGTELMKNTVFSKLKDKDSKGKMIKAMNDITKKEIYDFEATSMNYPYENEVRERRGNTTAYRESGQRAVNEYISKCIKNDCSWASE